LKQASYDMGGFINCVLVHKIWLILHISCTSCPLQCPSCKNQLNQAQSLYMQNIYRAKAVFPLISP